MPNSGQFVMAGIKGKILSAEEQDIIEKNLLAGVILFSHNYESPAQLAELINSIQKTRSEYPLFIAADHEGGRVQRFKDSFTHFPPMFEIGKMESPKVCFEIHSRMAIELKACGVNLNFSPCCDIWSNPQNKVIGDRSFGTDKEVVSTFISAAIRGLQTNGMISCAKHFPGHGDTTKDSHYDLPYVKTSLEILKERELVPFVKAIKSRVEMIMMGHLVVDAFDETLPCSLSPKAHEYLRKELKFSKVIVSDDMCMKAIMDHFSPEEAAIKAMLAGTDLLIYRDLETALRGLEGIRQGKKDNVLKRDLLTAKSNRLMALKESYLKEYAPVYIPNITKNMDVKIGQELLAQLNSKVVSTQST